VIVKNALSGRLAFEWEEHGEWYNLAAFCGFGKAFDIFSRVTSQQRRLCDGG
jgi:hypothetical protein